MPDSPIASIIGVVGMAARASAADAATGGEAMLTLHAFSLPVLVAAMSIFGVLPPT